MLGKTFKIFIGLSLLSNFAFGAANPCEFPVHASYSNLNKRYMTQIHLPDYEAASAEWERTLYGPLRAHVLSVLKKSGKKSHFVYVAPGPSAPLFGDPIVALELLDCISEITLVDISQFALRSAYVLLKKLNPDLVIHSVQADLTAGFAQTFATSLKELARSRSLAQLSAQLNAETLSKIWTADADSSDQLLRQAFADGVPENLGDYVYSELVATFTGTAAKLAFEMEIARKFAGDRDRGTLLPSIETRLLRYWQAYNEQAYLRQLDMMALLGKPVCILDVATDTEKIFDSGRPSITSFRDGNFPEATSATRKLRTDLASSPIYWVDAAHDKTAPGTAALEPHKHKVDFAVFQKVPQ